MPIMSMHTGNYNGHFLGNNSAKPIAGVCLRDAYRGDLQQARVSYQFVVTAFPGNPVTIVNEVDASTTNAGMSLNPNVLNITNSASSHDDLSGFVVETPNMLQEEGDNVPFAIGFAVTNVALLGSGVEMYLPAGTALANTQVGGKTAIWDFTNKCVVPNTDTKVASYLEVLSPVVDGVAPVMEDGYIEYKPTKVVKVRV